MATELAAAATAPRIEYRIEVEADVRVTIDGARQSATAFLLHRVGNMLSAGQPVLVLTASKVRWEVPVIYGLPGHGMLGKVGDLVVHVETGEVLLDGSTPPSIEEIECCAEALYRDAAGASPQAAARA